MLVDCAEERLDIKSRVEESRSVVRQERINERQ